MKTALSFHLSLLALVGAGATASAQFVTVGDLGNPNDPSDGDAFAPGVQNYGAVGYTYAIGTYEVTLNQYATFLNAVAATDTFALYNTSMASNLNSAGISRTGSSGSYVYGVIGSGDRPVTYVSFYDAMRYANWLHNGGGAGSTETGAYTLLGGTAVPSNGTTVTRNGGAQFWIPSENEWYKAAYYDPSAGGPADDYWLFATRSDTHPTNNSVGAGANRGNSYVGDFATTQSAGYSASQNYLTPVGAYTDSASHYGTFDQGGNVFEWNDTVLFVPDSPDADPGQGFFARVARGGNWASGYFEGDVDPGQSGTTGIHAQYRLSHHPATEDSGLGFRIATVPEPSSALLLAGSGLALLLRRRRGDR